MKTVIFASLLVGVAAMGGALAAENPIADRKAVMKNNGAAVGVLARMVRGEAEYDAVAAQLAMRVIHSGSAGLPGLFPEGSESGGDTEAAPKIWEDRAGFEAIAAKSAADAAAAIGPAGQGLDELRGVFAAVAKGCGDCHESYRVKKN